MNFAIVVAFVSLRAFASGHLVKYLVATTIYRFPVGVIVKGPTISIPTQSNKDPTGIGCNSSCEIGFPCRWQVSQDLIYSAIVLYRFGQ